MENAMKEILSGKKPKKNKKVQVVDLSKKKAGSKRKKSNGSY